MFKKNALRKISQKRGRYTSVLSADFSGRELPVSRIIRKYFHRLENLTITLTSRCFPVRCAQQFFLEMDKIFQNNKKLRALTIVANDTRLLEDFMPHIPENISGLSLQGVLGVTSSRPLSIVSKL